MSGLQRIPWVRDRLDQWGVWLLVGTSRSGGSILARLADAVAQGGRRRSHVPIDNIECALTDSAVARLPNELKTAISTWHTSEGTLDGIAEELSITKITLQRRLAQADRRIEEWFKFRKERAERLRSNI
ncbi:MULTISPECIES: hypothetical protein [Achromobacter]|uniref:hypothetical protein n=1 Tax=Achromobacter TaxID=222 RepID=UPI0011250A15|nr:MULTISPECIES: hypothetical protein [Achromobacter]